MFDTSSAYRESLDSGYLNTDVTGTITLSNGRIYEFTEKDIVPASLGFDNKAVNGNDFCFGGIYVGELSIDLMLAIDRYSLEDAEIKISYFQTTLEGVTQEIPLGIFYVYEATRTKKIISLKAYDGMTKFDTAIEENTSGYLYDIALFISEKCGVELAQTEEEINGFVNADWWLNLDTEQVATYREALSQIGMLCGRFATIDRFGRLSFRAFQTLAAQDSISARRRTESRIQDFKTYFCGVKARFLANTNFYPYLALDETIAKGLVLDLGDISLFLGEEESKKTIMANLLEVVTSIIYVPAEFSTVSDPSLDLGDCLELLDVNNTTESVITLVHSISWKYHGTQKVLSYGSDPRMSGVISKEERILSQLENQLASKDLVVKTYTNSKKISVDSKSEKEVFLFNFATTAATTVMFMGTIPFESTADGHIVLQSYLDGVLDETSVVRQYVERGQHSVSLTGYYPMKADGRATLKVTMITEYFESDVRIQNSNIISLMDYAKNQAIEVDEEGVPHLTTEYEQQEVDTTPLTVTIRKSTIKGILFAQGIAGAGQWDGTINITDMFEPVKVNMLNPFSVIRVGKFDERVSTRTHLVMGVHQSEDFRAVDSFREIADGEFIEGTAFEKKDIPHREGVDFLAPVSLDRRFVLGFMSSAITADIKEEEEN